MNRARSSSLPAALRGSDTWPRVSEPRAKPLTRDVVHRDLKPENVSLRGGGAPKTLPDIRRIPRELGAAAIDRARVELGLSNGQIAAPFGMSSDREGAEICSSKIPITHGEAALNLPLLVYLSADLDLLEKRLITERALGNHANAAVLVMHIEALRRLRDALRPTG